LENTKQSLDNINLEDFMQSGSVPFSGLYLESGQIAGKINTSEIVSGMLADAAVTTAKIANLAVDNDKLKALAVDAAKLASSAVTSTKIANLAVGSAAIAALAVGTGHIANLAVLNGKIGNLEVTEGKIGSLAVTSAKIGSLAVNDAKIATATISSGKIASLNADVINAGTITGRTLKANGGSDVDVWVENTGYIRFREGGSTKAYMKSTDNSLKIDADNNVNIEADSVDVYYEQDNDNADCHWRSYSDNLRMKLDQDGNLAIDGAYTDGGADYAEMFESVNGKKIKVGETVVLENDKIRSAKKGENPIGVISETAGIIANSGGNDSGENWTGKYLKDELGRFIYEEAEYWLYRVRSKEGHLHKKSSWSSDKKPIAGSIIKKKLRKKINPEWNKDEKYIPREERPEWNVVGLLGRVRILKGQPIAPSWIKLREISNSLDEYLIK